MTRTLIHSLLLTTTVASSLALAKAPSSEIPEKREFPLNKAINPCEDFHKYVCSEVESSFKLRPDRSAHIFAFNDSSERLLEIKKKFMEDLPKKKDLNERTMQLRDFYLSCMDSKAKATAEKGEVSRFQKDIQKIESADDLVTFLNTQQPKGLFSPLVWMNNMPDPDNAKKLNIVIGGSLMGLPDHKYYEQADLMMDYKKLMTAFFNQIDPKGKDGNAEKRAQAVIDLEKDFIKVYPVASTRRQRWSERFIYTQDEIIKKFPNLKFEMLFKKTPKTALVSNPIHETATFLNEELPKRPLSVWKDLILFTNLSDEMDDAYPKFFQQGFDFQKKYFGGPEKRAERQERCTRLVTGYFTKELDAALIDQVFPNFDETKVQEVAAKIRSSILQGLEDNKWLSRDAKKEALVKIKTARLQLVKPHNDREWDFQPIRHYSPTDQMVNQHLYREANFSKNLHELGEPANQDAWGMGPLTVNAYYSPMENKFVLPIGILQFPFYNKDGSLIENLGAVGAVMGHELGHGVDDNGSKFDAEGRLKQWMSTKDIVEFEKRGQMMVDQFNKIGHDGKLTLGENVADLVGLTFAYNAAFPGNKGSIEDKKTFFVAYGRLWCNVIRPDFEKLMRKTDPHSSGEARINEQVKHQPGFAEAFQCKPGDKMT
ncbi:MAG: M13 family metallopeptidase, partial [Bdellovibrio sp.]|nr:M13 family metallopeptidase [Bdellovibrio sp.]